MHMKDIWPFIHLKAIKRNDQDFLINNTWNIHSPKCVRIQVEFWMVVAYLPGQRYFYRHGHDFSQQAAVESRHEGSGVVVREDQRHLQAGEDRGVVRFISGDTGKGCLLFYLKWKTGVCLCFFMFHRSVSSVSSRQNKKQSGSESVWQNGVVWCWKIITDTDRRQSQELSWRLLSEKKKS